MLRIITIGLLLLSLMTGTGCIRVAREITEGLPPPNRFYAGTKCLPTILPTIPFVITYNGHITRKPKFTDIPSFAFLGTAFIIDVPLEVVVDTLLLPVDGILYACYQASPPLDKYLYDNDLEGLKARLEKGADPNAVTAWFIEKHPPLYTAYVNGQEDFFDLLLEYGAAPTFEMLMTHDLSKHAAQKVAMLRNAFKDGCTKEALEDVAAKWIVSGWIREHLIYSYRSSPDDSALADILIILMEQGFPPHEWNSSEGENPDKKTPLDVVMENDAMETAAKDRLIASMRAHGAKTYCETHNLEPSFKHLKTEGLNICPIFQPVVDILKESKKADMFSLSDSYPGVDGPVLVIDAPRVEEFSKVEPNLRWNINFRRRISETEWSDPPEVLEVPAMYRIVLTPPGRRLPSQRPQGMPTDRGFWEAWYTLPTCEMYIEHAMYGGKRPDSDLLKICLLSVGHNDKRELLRRLVYAQSEVEPSIMERLKWPAATNYEDKSVLDRLQWKGADNGKTFEMSESERKWLANTTKALADMGITAEWRTAIGSLGFYTKHAFSTHRDLAKTTPEALPLAPHPDEIAVVLMADVSPKEANVYVGRSGSDYWNASYGQFTYKSNSKNIKGRIPGIIFVFHGDSVPQERVEQIIKAIEKSFK